MTQPRDWTNISDQAFRSAWREWLAENYPDEWRSPFLRITGDDERRWLGMLDEAGWRAPGLGRDVGGLGLDVGKQLIYQDELDSQGTARCADLGAFLFAPILVRYGTDEQKARFLPGILSGKELWCQGYSEPGAGSDLASLRTTAVVAGDELVINGQKIWTSMAAFSDHIFMLVRTGRFDKKQAGITFVVAPLDTPGIDVRPIRNLSGYSEFCEVFFDEARVPLTNMIGEKHQGWTVAKALLGVERIMTGSPNLANRAFASASRVAQALEPSLRAAYSDQLATLHCDLMDLKALYADVGESARSGQLDTVTLSTLKIVSSELFQRISELLVDMAGDAGGIRDAMISCGMTEDIYRTFMVSRPTTIYGGTGEIQRNIIARLLMGPEGKDGPTP